MPPTAPTGKQRSKPKKRGPPDATNQAKRRSAERPKMATGATRMPELNPEAPTTKKARSNAVNADAGGNKKNQQQPCSSTTGTRNIEESSMRKEKEKDVDTWDSVKQAENSGGRQKVGSIVVLSDEDRKMMALVELKKQQENRAELTINDNLMKCSHRIKTMYFSHQKFVHFGKMSGLEESRLKKWLTQSLKLQEVEFENIWPRLRTQITRTLRVKRSGCASAMKYQFYGKSYKCSQ